MASEAKHTPLPWFLQTSVRLASIHGADGKCVASTGSVYSRGEKECNANAELIVTAVNERATLLAERDAALVAVDGMRKALEEADGCFEAALAEGWLDAIASGEIETIRDIWNRRLAYTRALFPSALSSLPTAQVKG